MGGRGDDMRTEGDKNCTEKAALRRCRKREKGGTTLHPRVGCSTFSGPNTNFGTLVFSKLGKVPSPRSRDAAHRGLPCASQPQGSRAESCILVRGGLWRGVFGMRLL